MNLQELIQYKILDEMAALFRDIDNSEILLTEIGYPAFLIPPFPQDGNTLGYWRTICTQINNGVVNAIGGNDLQPLVNAARERFPSNPIFSKFCSSNGSGQVKEENQPDKGTPEFRQNSPEAPIFVSLLVQGWRGRVSDLLQEVMVIASQQGMSPETIHLQLSNAEGILLNLNDDWTTEQAASLADALVNSPINNQNQLDCSVSSADFQDYLISQLFIEGPDQAKFGVENIRASTLLRDVAEGIMKSQYDSKGMERGGRQGKEFVVDLLNSDGSANRLNPDQTLHDQNIQEGDTLSVSPERTAGVHPQIREEALARTRLQVLEYAKNHPGFEVSANSFRSPTEYVLKFQAPSFAPPLNPGEAPISIDRHEVYLTLPSEFPMKAPDAFWQTPIFHPNIHPTVNKVCLGALGEYYVPGLEFGDLCQLLVDLASYQNYTLEEGYNPQAREWALSDEGEIAIEQRGGKSFTRKLLHEIHEPRSLSIKRM